MSDYEKDPGPWPADSSCTINICCFSVIHLKSVCDPSYLFGPPDSSPAAEQMLHSSECDELETCLNFFFFFWLHWVLVAAHGFFVVACRLL